MRKTLLYILMLGVALSSCEKQSEDRLYQSAETGALTKVRNYGDDYLKSDVLVKFASVPDEQTLNSLSDRGVRSLKPLFNTMPGKEELMARHGLDRWYVAELDEDAVFDDAVAFLCYSESVSTVEYDAVSKLSEVETVVYPMEQEVQDAPTKADTPLPFNDKLLSMQWHYYNGGNPLFSRNVSASADINVKDVWEALEMGGDPDIIVAVVDEGVKYNHPDLKDNMWTNPGEIPGNYLDDDGNGYVDDYYGYNFADNGAITWDKEGDTGHGTHCAGTIAAVNNNNIGVAGVAGGTGKSDGCRIMSCQIFSGKGGAYSKTEAQAVQYAADMGASVISCSFGNSSPIASDDAYLNSGGSVLYDVIKYFEDPARKCNTVTGGGIAVFAAGNEAHNYAHYPGAMADIISVSAFGPDMLPTNYTNYGPGCNIAAPGGEIGQVSSIKSLVLSTVPKEVESNGHDGGLGSYDYGYMQGTSMACPHVSGVVALALSYAKKLGKKFTVQEFKNLVLSSTNDIDTKISTTEKKDYVDVPITGTSYYYKASNPLKLAPFYHQVGTGAIDAWQLMMHIEGINTLVAKVGATSWLDLTEFFGTSSVSLTYLSVDVPEETVKSLGLQNIKAGNARVYPAVPEEGYAYVQFGRLYLNPTKVGSGKITIRAIGGGDHLGGGSNPPGGMEMSQTISIISREVKSENGGWL